MTVTDLIEVLQNFPGDATVFTQTGDQKFDEVIIVDHEQWEGEEDVVMLRRM